jgi:hypothetical protein
MTETPVSPPCSLTDYTQTPFEDFKKIESNLILLPLRQKQSISLNNKPDTLGDEDAHSTLQLIEAVTR